MDTELKVRPYQLMCIFCKSESGFDNTPEDEKLKKIKDAISADSDMPITLVCNVASNFSYQNPGKEDDTPEGELYNKKRDIDIIQRMGLVPGATMPARCFIKKLAEEIKSSRYICGGLNPNSEIWKGCEKAKRGYYDAAIEKGWNTLIPKRAQEERDISKKTSVEEMYNAKMLFIRPHHLMCMACFSAGPRGGGPIKEDNLFEAVDIIRKNPDIPVKLVEGPCMICPPCSVFLKDKNICIGGRSMALRDEKKDLDVLQKLDLKYGDVLSGKELYRRLFTAIKSTKEICGFGDGIARSYEWTGCGMDGYPAYEKARKEGMKIPGLKIKE